MEIASELGTKQNKNTSLKLPDFSELGESLHIFDEQTLFQ